MQEPIIPRYDVIERYDATQINLPAFVIPPSCPVCGDDIDIHEWFDINVMSDRPVNCDRAN